MPYSKDTNTHALCKHYGHEFDNRAENLELLTKAEHGRKHASERWNNE